MISVKITTDSSETLINSIEEFTLDQANEFVDDLYTEVRQRTPVDTGLAQASWEKVNADKVGDVAQVGNPQDYLKYVEDGTIYIAPRKFIATSVIRQINKRR